MTDSTKQPDLAELRRLLEAATPGPWTRQWNEVESPNSGIDIEAMGCRVALVEDPDDASEVANADLICTLRNAADWLIRAAEERDALLRAAEDAAKWLEDDRWGKWTYMESSEVYADKDQCLFEMREVIAKCRREAPKAGDAVRGDAEEL